MSRLSPSRMVTTRRGRPSRPAIAVTAIASVGATTAAKAKAAARVIAGISAKAANPTATTVKATSPTDRSRMLSRRARTSTTDVRIAAAKSRGGRMPYRMSSGWTSTCGTPGMKETAPPTMTRATGADQPSRPTSPVTATVVMTKSTIQVIVPTGSTQPVSGKIERMEQRGRGRSTVQRRRRSCDRRSALRGDLFGGLAATAADPRRRSCHRRVSSAGRSRAPRRRPTSPGPR